MEIELITTKKKLTASIVKQIPFASAKEKEYLVDTHFSKIYGYVTVGDKKYIIAQGQLDLIKIPALPWRIPYPGSRSIRTGIETERVFESVEERDRWLEVHNEILRIGKQTHIYL